MRFGTGATLPTGPRIDLGCGSRPRAEIGVTKLSESSPVDVTHGDDRWLVEYGWGPPYPRNPAIMEMDVEEFVLGGQVPAGFRILMCHVLEHLRRPRRRKLATQEAASRGSPPDPLPSHPPNPRPPLPQPIPSTLC